MATLYISLLFTSILLSSKFSISKSELSAPNPVRVEKSAILHFYIHDALGGPNATIWEVARAAITNDSSTQFGLVRVIDDKLTAELSRDSAEVGRAQGLVASTGLSEMAITMNVNFVFTSGEFNGSTLCILGRNVVYNDDRELPVVSGTGKFRMARGYSIWNKSSYDPVENYAVLDCKVYVYYYA